MTLPHRLAEYDSPEGAQEYLEEYEKLHRKFSDRRERGLLQRFFRRVGPVESALDLPCGWGRYLPMLHGQGARVVESDFSGDMLKLSRSLFRGSPALGHLRAFGHQIPMADGAVELVFSMRLNHHLVDPEVRRQHLREVFRVARRWALFSYFDHDSVKSWTRRLRRRLGSKRRLKSTLSRGEVRALAAEAGFVVREDPLLFLIGSGPRLVLAERAPASPD
ncbi:MAG: class I SAM-dependent methyltransferase [Planctomycetes bacterium]|nr:class I SAM-dependent methyltransferase [Planctomycetota bacterium]